MMCQLICTCNIATTSSTGLATAGPALLAAGVWVVRTIVAPLVALACVGLYRLGRWGVRRGLERWRMRGVLVGEPVEWPTTPALPPTASRPAIRGGEPGQLRWSTLASTAVADPRTGITVPVDRH